jgi:hypothetical protein
VVRPACDVTVVRAYEARFGGQLLGTLFVYPRGEPWTGQPGESWIWGGSFWNHYDLGDRSQAANLLRLWRRMGAEITRGKPGD